MSRLSMPFSGKSGDLSLHGIKATSIRPPLFSSPMLSEQLRYPQAVHRVGLAARNRLDVLNVR